MANSMMGDQSQKSLSAALDERLLGEDQGGKDRGDPWADTCEEFMAAVPREIQGPVQRSLTSIHTGGFGLREWVSSIAWRGGRLPETIPADVIRVYLNDPEAVPLHDCEVCGMAVPVRPNRLTDDDREMEQVYFPKCPVCGGRTGPYLFVSRQIEGQPTSKSILGKNFAGKLATDSEPGTDSDSLRRQKPR